MESTAWAGITGAIEEEAEDSTRHDEYGRPPRARCPTLSTSPPSLLERRLTMHAHYDLCSICKGRCKNHGKLKPIEEALMAKSRRSGRFGAGLKLKREQLPKAKQLLKELKKLHVPRVVTVNLDAWIKRA